MSMFQWLRGNQDPQEVEPEPELEPEPEPEIEPRIVSGEHYSPDQVLMGNLYRI